MWKEGEAGDGRPPRTRRGAQSPGDGETDAVGPGPWGREASGRLCLPGQTAGAALDKACTVLGDGVGAGAPAWRGGPVELRGGDAGCRVGVWGWEYRGATLGQPGRRHLGVPGTGMETAQQMSFCKTGGAAGAAESWGGGCGGSGRSTQRTCWRESPRQYRGDAG